MATQYATVARQSRTDLTASARLLEARDRFPELLVSRQSFERALALTSRLPADQTLAGGFECRLDARSNVSDFALQIRRSAPERFRGRWIQDPSAPAGTALDRVCSRIGRFLEHWRTGNLAEIHRVYLEFDMVATHEPQPPPSVLFSVRHEASHCEAAVHEAIEACKMLAPGSLPENLKGRLRALTTGAIGKLALADVGLMLCRGAGVVRLCFAPWGTLGMIRNLQSLGWPYRWSGMEELEQDLYTAGVNHVHLALDLADDFLPRLGIECYLLGNPPWERDKPERLLNFLARNGLCCPEKAAHVVSLVGRGLPSDLRSVHIRCMLLGISHFKIVIDRGHITGAKVYLYAYASRAVL